MFFLKSTRTTRPGSPNFGTRTASFACSFRRASRSAAASPASRSIFRVFSCNSSRSRSASCCAHQRFLFRLLRLLAQQL